MTAPASADVTNDETRTRVLSLLRRHGWDATSFQALETGFSYWFDDAADACVAYVDTGRCRVAAGAPVAPRAQLADVAARFVADARRAGRRACFFAAEEGFLDAARALDAIQIGEQPVWDPRDWRATLASSRSLREQLRRARAKGVVVRALSSREATDPGGATRQAIGRLIARWIGSRSMPPMGFLVAIEPFAFADERRYLVAERQGTLVGLLVAIPVHARHGWLLEDLLRDPSAPNGTAELLVDAAMRALAAVGAHYVTLGLAPLAGPVHGLLRVARRVARGLYDFRGVRAFKARLRPARWDAIHLAYPPDRGPAVALYDSLTAFARGSVVRFGAETVARRPALAVWGLAAMLVPWTCALAAVDARAWFPAPWTQRGWVAFDVALTIGLVALARRWRDWLSLLLATAITADAGMTAFEAVVFNAPRARSVLAWVVMLVACVAPALAAGLLWSVRRPAASPADAVVDRGVDGA